MNCSDCKYVKEIKNYERESTYECRFNAPIAGYKVSHIAVGDDEHRSSKHGMNEWPFDRVTFNLGVKVEKNYWCGQFKERTE